LRRRGRPRILQSGVTLTRIVRGHRDPSAVWTVEVAIPAGPGSSDPDAPPAAIRDEGGARVTAYRLHAASLEPRVEKVNTPLVADFSGVRETDAIRQQGDRGRFSGSSIYTGWDGEPDDVAGSTGPWHVDVVTIDPEIFSGRLEATYGPDLEQRETTSRLAAVTRMEATPEPLGWLPCEAVYAEGRAATQLLTGASVIPVSSLRLQCRHSRHARTSSTNPPASSA